MAYHAERGKALETALKAARAHFAVEGIHDLRVEIKRLRSFYRLCARVAPEFERKPVADALKPLFRAAGGLRDIDIYQALAVPQLRKLDLSEYLNKLKQDELSVRSEFGRVAGKFRVGRLAAAERRLGVVLSDVGEEKLRTRLRKRVRKQIDLLERLLNRKKLSEEELHDVRKAAKSLRYILDVWQACYGQEAPLAAGSVRLKATYGHLGEWHDAVLALRSVRKFRRGKNGRSVDDPAAYDAFEKELADRAEARLGAYRRGVNRLRAALARVARTLGEERSGAVQTTEKRTSKR